MPRTTLNQLKRDVTFCVLSRVPKYSILELRVLRAVWLGKVAVESLGRALLSWWDWCLVAVALVLCDLMLKIPPPPQGCCNATMKKKKKGSEKESKRFLFIFSYVKYYGFLPEDMPFPRTGLLAYHWKRWNKGEKVFRELATGIKEASGMV